LTTEEFIKVQKNPKVHKFVWACARRRSGRLELQEEFVQEAWLAISCAPGDWDDRAYAILASKAIYSAYWQNYKEMLMQFGRRQSRSTKASRGFVGSERDERASAGNWRK
jgi:hypothetical protein